MKKFFSLLKQHPAHPQTTENVSQKKGHKLRLEDRVFKELHSDHMCKNYLAKFFTMF